MDWGVLQIPHHIVYEFGGIIIPRIPFTSSGMTVIDKRWRVSELEGLRLKVGGGVLVFRHKPGSDQVFKDPTPQHPVDDIVSVQG